MLVTLATVLVALSIDSAAAQSGSAPVPSVGPTAVELIGDSLSHAARPYFPDSWRIVAQNGRPLSTSLALARAAASRQPGCVVVALGSNDVSARRSSLQVTRDIRRINAALAGVACVAWTTVKVAVRYYGADWSRWARQWNQLLRQEARGAVLDWNDAARRNPRWFLGDGLHMTVLGRVAYARFLARRLEVP